VLEALIKLYKSEDPLPAIQTVDLIVSISYATLPIKLTTGTRECLKKAIEYQGQFPRAPIAFSNPAHSGFEGCAERERELKQKMLGNLRYMSCGDCLNSVTEAQAICARVGLIPKRILIICGAGHSRSIRYIWERVFPHATILICCVPFSCEYGEEYPFKIERNGWIWFGATLARQILLMTLGLRRVGQMHHNAN
jgi:hypothetical protein